MENLTKVFMNTHENLVSGLVPTLLENIILGSPVGPVCRYTVITKPVARRRVNLGGTHTGNARCAGRIVRFRVACWVPRLRKTEAGSVRLPAPGT